MSKNLTISTKNGEQYLLLDEVIGEGSFSQVRKGLNLNNKLEVAVKILKQSHYQIATNQIAILKSLASFLGSTNGSTQVLLGENVLKFIDSFLGFNEFFIITELFGVSLASLLKKHPHPNCQSAVRTFGKILEGYKPLRNKRILHRDIKPSNILVQLNSSGEVSRAKFCDFGLSTVQKQTQQVFKSQHVGTIVYEAPEVIKFRQYSEKSEIWSFGIILFELLYGNLPYNFHDDVFSDSMNMYNIVMGSPIRFANVPPLLASLGERCLSRSSEKRINFQALVDQIEKILQNEQKVGFYSILLDSEVDLQVNKKGFGQFKHPHKDSILTKTTDSRKNSVDDIQQEYSFKKLAKLLTLAYKELRARFEAMKKPKKLTCINLLNLCDTFLNNQGSKDCLNYFSNQVLENLAITLAKVQIICQYSLDEKQISFNLKQFMCIDTLYLLFSVTKIHLQKNEGSLQRKASISILENHINFEGNSKSMGYYKHLRKKVLDLNLKQYKQNTNFKL